MHTLTESAAQLFNQLPLEQALNDLVVRNPLAGDLHVLAGKAVEEAKTPALRAAIWLYVDDLERSHVISQNINTNTGSFWHAIMHRREGDFPNSRYWLRMMRSHPVLNDAALVKIGYDPVFFISQVEQNPSDPTLVHIQRAEWKALFDWCLSNPSG